jgi:probable phosphoglycerate mutase
MSLPYVDLNLVIIILAYYILIDGDYYCLVGIAAKAEPLSSLESIDATLVKSRNVIIAVCQPVNASLVGDQVNYLQNIERPQNRYFIMRHGHSLANQQGIIVSHPDNGCAGYGLSNLGRDQVEASLRQADDLGADMIIISSDFVRARETADIAREILGCQDGVGLEQRLRERNFGEFELTPDSGYEEVWRQDILDPDSQARGVESVNQVMGRVTSLVVDLEKQYSNRRILMVSHGDALQILQTAFAHTDGSRHRQLTHLHTAEIRNLMPVDPPKTEIL